MSHVAIVARVTVKEGKADEYIAAFARLIGQARRSLARSSMPSTAR